MNYNPSAPEKARYNYEENIIETRRNHSIHSGTKETHGSDRHSVNAVNLSCRNHICNQIFSLQTVNYLTFHSSYLERVSLNSEDMIYQYDDDIQYIYFPETAVFSEYHILDDGRTSEIAMIGKEGVTGLETILNSSRTKHWSRILVSGNALRIESQVFKDEFNSNGMFREIILNYIEYYIGQTSRRIICNCYHLIEERLCFWLLMLSDRCESSEMHITHERIAQFLGVQRPSITRAFQSLREKEIVNYIRKRISILDRKGLEKAACSCYEPIDKV